ncbi:MAG: adenylate/guanylate cyclase domain-containing protein [Myxococcota bacterium]|nr:adenylate/guanylate cyclase domain-containing protein [Myxococcota bacterium]
MVLLTAGSIIWGTYVRSRDTILINSEELILQAARESQERVLAYLEPAARTVRQLNRLHVQSSVDLDDFAAAEGILFALQHAQPEISMLGYGAEDGRFLMVERTTEGALWTKEVSPGTGAIWRLRAPSGGLADVTAIEPDPTDAYDPRIRPWYQGARAAEGLIWTDVYVFWSRKEPGITVAVPVDDGVVSADVRLRELSGFLESLDLSDHSVAFIMDYRGRLIATSEGEALLTDRALIAAAASVTPSIAALAAAPSVQAFVSGSDAPSQTVRFSVDDAPHIGGLIPLSIGSEREWLVGVTAPESDFLGALHDANRRNAIIGAILMLAALILSRILARWIAGTLQVLVIESARVRALQLDRGDRAGARFREVADVIDAFEDMKTGLRAFQRYLPIKLVRVLLEEQIEPRLGGVERQISLYFSDVGGFTTISERLGPLRMAERLGDYLGMLSTTIQESDGTVVQFVGDEVMAMWGAPLPVPDHADRVCEAALTVQERIPDLWEVDESHPLMHTRIGLHTATVVVGHFGARDRMYYGAIGDGVNLASRLESANKQYGTKILVSDATRALVTPDAFVFRLIDRIIAKGKREPTTIYELIGRHGQISSTDRAKIERYEAAFADYQARRFTDAAAQLAEHPDDPPAVMLRKRCQHYSEHPPDEEWDGVYVMVTK